MQCKKGKKGKKKLGNTEKTACSGQSCGTQTGHSKVVYADNAATTPVDPAVVEAMLPYFTSTFGNPSGFYSQSRDAKNALEDAREKVAKLIGAERSEIYFISGGTEGDNWAIKGALEFFAKKGKHIITSAIEHHAITHTLEHLEKKGLVEATYLPVNSCGQVSAADLEAAIRDDTVLVSVMLANNEIGTILSVKELAEIAHRRDICFHTDAVQAIGHIPVDVKDLGVDMLTLSAHKFNGPRGIGAMYIRKGIKLPPLIDGGGQERNRRSGTENLAGIIGLTKALELSVDRLPHMSALAGLRDKLINGVLDKIPYSRLTGDPVVRLPGTASFIFESIEGESLILLLDRRGIASSSGSACSSGSLDPSHVLLAIGFPHELAHGSLRLSLAHDVTEEDIDYILEVLPVVVERLRSMSPLWDEKTQAPREEKRPI
jgi:cysteine desulfurase